MKIHCILFTAIHGIHMYVYFFSVSLEIIQAPQPTSALSCPLDLLRAFFLGSYSLTFLYWDAFPAVFKYLNITSTTVTSFIRQWLFQEINKNQKLTMGGTQC